MSYSKAIQVLMSSPVSSEMINYMTNVTFQILPIQHSDTEDNITIPSLQTFITRIVNYTHVPSSTFLSTIVYLNRLKKLLPPHASGIQSTRHRIFLACLILSAKYNNDSSPLNIHWMNHTDDIFCLHDINLMERQLLNLLNWDLSITESDLLKDLHYLLHPIIIDLQNTKNIWRLHHKRSTLQFSQNTNKLYCNTKDNILTHDDNISPVSSRSISPISMRSLSPLAYSPDNL